MKDVIRSVDRALDVIIYLYHEGKERGISEISRDLDTYKSTIHRTLKTLENKGFVYQNQQNGKYWLGMKLYGIGMASMNKTSLIETIKPYTKKLFDEFQEVVNVSILELNNNDIPRSIIIHKEENPNKVLTVNPPIGSSSEFYCSSVGKCLVAFGKNINLEKYKRINLKKYTENTIIDWDDLITELNKIKSDGYAIDEEELEKGLTCIGAPIIGSEGYAVAAISLSGPTQRMREGDFNYKIDKLIRIVKEINLKLN